MTKNEERDLVDLSERRGSPGRRARSQWLLKCPWTRFGELSRDVWPTQDCSRSRRLPLSWVCL